MTRSFRFIFLGLALFAVFSVFMTIPGEGKYRTGADEGTYYFYAANVSSRGMEVFTEAGQEYLSNPAFRLQPSPLRVGHLLATGMWFKMFPVAYVSLAQFSWFCFVLMLLISFYYSRKHFGDDVAYVFVMLLSSSPLLMAMGRRALSESHGNLWCTAAAWLMLDFLVERKNSRFLLFLMAFILAVLARESAIIIWPFFAGVLFVCRYVYRIQIPSYCLFAVFLVPAIVIGSVYVAVFGGFSSAWDVFCAVFFLHSDPLSHMSHFGLAFCSGPWFRYMVDYSVVTPLILLMFLGFAGSRIVAREVNGRIGYFWAYFAWVFMFYGFILHHKDMRFMINIDMVLTLFAVIFMWDALRNVDREKTVRFVLLAAVVVFFMNYHSFTKVFCIGDVYDPISYELLRANKIVP